ncbi:hypothetical protein [Phaeobacter sp. CECT 5382]|uniref:hypothetical protein n=1 Tax=Phaeobacter sp. CECT 5382 TaxID=1712645 RepID=UPI0012E369F0|nr:hypothetical protein [Phaeobacter sp. CECT 5382]
MDDTLGTGVARILAQDAKTTTEKNNGILGSHFSLRLDPQPTAAGGAANDKATDAKEIFGEFV